MDVYSWTLFQRTAICIIRAKICIIRKSAWLFLWICVISYIYVAQSFTMQWLKTMDRPPFKLRFSTSAQVCVYPKANSTLDHWHGSTRISSQRHNKTKHSKPNGVFHGTWYKCRESITVLPSRSPVTTIVSDYRAPGGTPLLRTGSKVTCNLGSGMSTSHQSIVSIYRRISYNSGDDFTRIE